MITREQLEQAALAAGRRVVMAPIGRDTFDALDVDTLMAWRPHADPGDAARLAVRLNMSVDVDGSTAFAHMDGYEELDDSGYGTEKHDGTEPDKQRAWCEAVTLCAAAVGERMRKGGA